jgi:hypothetical protein
MLLWNENRRAVIAGDTLVEEHRPVAPGDLTETSSLQALSSSGAFSLRKCVANSDESVTRRPPTRGVFPVARKEAQDRLIRARNACGQACSYAGLPRPSPPGTAAPLDDASTGNEIAPIFVWLFQNLFHTRARWTKCSETRKQKP